MNNRDACFLAVAVLLLAFLAKLIVRVGLDYWRRRIRGPLITVECNCGKRFIFRFTHTGQEAPDNDLTQRRLEIHRAGCWDAP